MRMIVFSVCFDEDPCDYFNRQDVRSLLKKITGYEQERTFFKHKVDHAFTPKIKVLTDAELSRVGI